MDQAATVVLDLDRLEWRAGELIRLVDELESRGVGCRALNVTIGDAIIDRVVHSAHRLELKNGSLRRKQAADRGEDLAGTAAK